jgi:SAM-dependent methyltransferase
MRFDTGSPITPAEYYDARHARGWMDVWPDDKRHRVVGLIRDLGLPDQARVLEFGCGVGVFAAAVKAAMPRLEVHACDISPTAIARARERFPNISFHVLPADGCRAPSDAYDLVFTHHVLEHVQDLNAVLSHIARVLKLGGRAFHVFPCGNEGSLEYSIACLTKEGILPGGLFWIDDGSHVRRLSSFELDEASRSKGLVLRQAYFVNQFWGGIEYLTDTYHGTLFGWLRTLRGRNRWASARLFCLFAGVTAVSLVRKGPAYILSTYRHPRPAGRRMLFWSAIPVSLMAWPLARMVGLILRWARDREWRRSKLLPNGSEAYLTFEKE